MTELAFTSARTITESPITLVFGDGSLIRLDFTAPWSAPTAPFTLEFDGELPPAPVEPPRWGEIGIGVTSAWVDTGLHVSLHEIGSTSRVLHTEFNGVRVKPVSVHSDTLLSVHIGQLAYCDTLLPSVIGERLTGFTETVWSYSSCVDVYAVTSWVNVSDGHQADAGILWVVGPTGYELTNGLVWVNPKLAQLPFSVAYSGKFTDGDITFRWGPSPSKWVCSNWYIKPDSPIALMFNGNRVDTESPLMLVFTPSEVVCRYDDGGGLIDNGTTLPSIDFNEPISPQIQRTYIMKPTLTCTRVSDGAPIVIQSVSISDARGQFTHSANIEFSSKADALKAANELLLVSMNGYQFYVIAEEPRKSASFNSESHSSSGRGRSALLSDPYVLKRSYTNTVSRTVSGAMNDVLSGTGWSFELAPALFDFVIPAGAFSVYNQSPANIITEAVSQFGCMVIQDEFNSRLKCVPRYPVSPWLMGSSVADVAIHDAVILDYSSSHRVDEACNAAWVRGEQQGVSAKVRRAGTAGDKPTADITAQLILDAQSARYAGTSAIADTGNKENITVNLPVMNDLPPLTKGMTISVSFRGELFKTTCDARTISARVSDQGDIDISQSVTLIRHLE